MYLDDALDQIAAIRGQMARAGVYRGFRASAAFGSALAAVAVAAVQPALVPDPTVHPYDYLDLWCGTAAVCAAAVSAGVYLRYRRTASPTQRALARSAAGQFAPCLVVGGLLTVTLAECATTSLWLLPGLWSLLFGLGVLATRPLLPRGTGGVGLFYVVAGVAAVALSQALGPFSPWLMAVPFGVGQSAAAFVLYWNLERSPSVAADDPGDVPSRPGRIARTARFLRRRPILTAALAVTAAVAAWLLLSAAVFAFYFFPGGVRSTYDAVDGDRMLTRDATSALPIIAAVRQYQSLHGGPPATAVELAKLLPTSSFNPAAPGMVAGWTYFADAKPGGYQLYRRLGWDPSLVYHGTPAGGTWAFEPGDGSPEKPIRLNP